jgi:hypothetical protein
MTAVMLFIATIFIILLLKEIVDILKQIKEKL